MTAIDGAILGAILGARFLPGLSDANFDFPLIASFARFEASLVGLGTVVPKRPSKIPGSQLDLRAGVCVRFFGGIPNDPKIPNPNHCSILNESR